MNCAPHLPLGRSPLPLRHLAEGVPPSATMTQTVVTPMRIQPFPSARQIAILLRIIKIHISDFLIHFIEIDTA